MVVHLKSSMKNSAYYWLIYGWQIRTSLDDWLWLEISEIWQSTLIFLYLMCNMTLFLSPNANWFIAQLSFFNCSISYSNWCEANMEDNCTKGKWTSKLQKSLCLSTPQSLYTDSYSQHRWLSWMRRLTGDQEVAGSTPAEVGNILSWRLIMKYFLRSFSPFRWFKKGSCQFLVKECAQYWLTA